MILMRRALSHPATGPAPDSFSEFFAVTTYSNIVLCFIAGGQGASWYIYMRFVVLVGLHKSKYVRFFVGIRVRLPPAKMIKLCFYMVLDFSLHRNRC